MFEEQCLQEQSRLANEDGKKLAKMFYDDLDAGKFQGMDGK